MNYKKVLAKYKKELLSLIIAIILIIIKLNFTVLEELFSIPKDTFPIIISLQLTHIIVFLITAALIYFVYKNINTKSEKEKNMANILKKHSKEYFFTIENQTPINDRFKLRYKIEIRDGEYEVLYSTPYCLNCKLKPKMTEINNQYNCSCGQTLQHSTIKYAHNHIITELEKIELQ